MKEKEKKAREAKKAERKRRMAAFRELLENTKSIKVRDDLTDKPEGHIQVTVRVQGSQEPQNHTQSIKVDVLLNNTRKYKWEPLQAGASDCSRETLSPCCNQPFIAYRAQRPVKSTAEYCRTLHIIVSHLC